MAYNFYPTAYQPIYPQYQQAQQSQGLLWVQGLNAAKSYPVAPNQTVTLFDSEANVIYLKSADVSGMPSLKILDYTVRDIDTQRPEIKAEDGFATKEDIEAVKAEIDALRTKLEHGKEQKDGK
jgi:hypothetical protein